MTTDAPAGIPELPETPHRHRRPAVSGRSREPVVTNLRKARENRGLSQAAVAKKLRLSRSPVAQTELTNRPVTADELAKFADRYGTRGRSHGHTRRH